MLARKYEPHEEKHKEPKGFGSLCQKSVSLEHARKLLQLAIPDPDNKESNKLYSHCGVAIFVAQPTRIEEDIWHGYPEIGSRVPTGVLKHWRDDGQIDQSMFNRMRKQREIPEKCSC